jgi:hypothetical protein
MIKSASWGGNDGGGNGCKSRAGNKLRGSMILSEKSSKTSLNEMVVGSQGLGEALRFHH